MDGFALTYEAAGQREARRGAGALLDQRDEPESVVDGCDGQQGHVDGDARPRVLGEI